LRAFHGQSPIRAITFTKSIPATRTPPNSGQAAHAYGGSAARLLAAKDRYDPEGIFTAIPLPPRT
jgi:hypothetical protein